MLIIYATGADNPNEYYTNWVKHAYVASSPSKNQGLHGYNIADEIVVADAFSPLIVFTANWF